MYVRVEVKPGSRRESVIRLDEKTLSVSVKEPAERNLANLRVRELVAEEYGVSKAGVKMISGHRSPRKIFDVSGV